MQTNLENILESILFVAGEAVDVSDICSKLDATKAEIQEAAKKLQKRYGEDSGIKLLSFNGKLQLSSNPAFADEVALVLNPIRQRNLSKATLETAAIIAYKQPITRLEIEEIRGVGSDYAISILLEHGLIEVVGKKDTVGHPSLFGTTDEFLKRFDIQSIDELPDYDKLLEQIKVIRTKDDSLYNHFDIDESTEEMEKKLGVAMSKISDAKEEDDLVTSNSNKEEDQMVDDGNDYFKDVDDETEAEDYFNEDFSDDDLV